VVEYLKVFRRVGFFCSWWCGITATTRVEPDGCVLARSVKLLIVAISQRSLLVPTILATSVPPVLGEYIYVGGGALVTIVIVILVVMLLRRR
jgi:hypothetical protein